MNWEDCPWLQKYNSVRTPECNLCLALHNTEGASDFYYLSCLKDDCPLVKLDTRMTQLFEYLDIVHPETAKKLSTGSFRT